ncbi:hypothetical protein F4604DRAFT_1940173 [Suillus subluteus]|nr:hypothetical protein F4604DRAFT_1940173 [Suillus subluteus]
MSSPTTAAAASSPTNTNVITSTSSESTAPLPVESPTTSASTTATSSPTMTASLASAMSSPTTTAAASSPTNTNVITSTSSESTAPPPPVANNASFTRISDSQIDPSLLNNGGEGVVPSVTAPSIPLTPSAIPPVSTSNPVNPAPQFIFPTPDPTPPLTVCPASLSDPSGAPDMSALTAVTNRKRCAPAALEEPRSKRSKRPSAKALAAEMTKGSQRKKKSKGGRAGNKASEPKSAAYVDSEHENDPTPTY